MGNRTTSVRESNIRLDDQEFFAYAASAKGKHTGWLREIGKEFSAKGKGAKFTFKYFLESKLVGYESNPELHVVLRAIEMHMARTKEYSFGRVELRGDVDELPRHILLDYFAGTLSFTYPVWHRADLGSVSLPARPMGAKSASAKAGRSIAAPSGLESGIAYVLRLSTGKSVKWFAAGISGARLHAGATGRLKTTECASREDAAAKLAKLVERKEAEGFKRFDRRPIKDILRKTSGWVR